MATTVERRGLLAYLIGAGVAGTLLVFPYMLRVVAAEVAPDFDRLTAVPFFLLPIAWGAWNWLHVRRALRPGIGVWGALLGGGLATGVNLLLVAEGRWFEGAVLLIAGLPAVYYLVWTFIVGTLNDALVAKG